MIFPMQFTSTSHPVPARRFVVPPHRSALFSLASLSMSLAPRQRSNGSGGGSGSSSVQAAPFEFEHTSAASDQESSRGSSLAPEEPPLEALPPVPESFAGTTSHKGKNYTIEVGHDLHA